MQTTTRPPLALAPGAAMSADCSWCEKEVELLRKTGGFPEGVVRAYASFYQIFGTDFLTLEEVAKLTGFSPEEAELAIMDAADWLMANSPYRSLPRRCLVCDHALGPADFPCLKEPVLVT